MKKYKSLFILSLLTVLLSACGGGVDVGSPGGPATPTPPPPQNTIVHLNKNNPGMGVQSINVKIILPPNTKKSLLDYNGRVTIEGSITANSYSCLKSASSFRCEANLSVGNVNANNCSIGGHKFHLQIVLKRGTEINSNYDLNTIFQDPLPWSCFAPN